MKNRGLVEGRRPCPGQRPSDGGGGATSDARLQRTVTTLAALLRVENDQSVQRAILYAALSTQPPVLTPDDLASLQQANGQQRADLAAFYASTSTTERELFLNIVSGRAVDDAASQEILAEQKAAASPLAPLTGNTGLDAATWYDDVSTTISDTRKVAGQLAGQITVHHRPLPGDQSCSKDSRHRADGRRPSPPARPGCPAAMIRCPAKRRGPRMTSWRWLRLMCFWIRRSRCLLFLRRQPGWGGSGAWCLAFARAMRMHGGGLWSSG